MDLSYADVLEILQLVENSTVEYLELNVGETKIVLDKSGQSHTRPDMADGNQPNLGVNDMTNVPQRSSEQGQTTPASQPPLAEQNDERPHTTTTSDNTVIKSPVVGVFYRQSEPGAPPYVEVGSRVEQGDTVGLLEVMKMFTSVTAPIAGIIEAILVDNNQFVEFDQPLMIVTAETAE